MTRTSTGRPSQWMAAVGSDPRVATLPDGLGVLAIYPPDREGADRAFFGLAAPHCRVSDGRTVVWQPPTPDDGFAGHLEAGTHVMDAELIGPGLPTTVAAKLGGRGPGAVLRWTQLEVTAKVSGIPAHLLLAGRVPMPDIPMDSAIVGDLAVTLARRDAQQHVSESTQEDTYALD